MLYRVILKTDFTIFARGEFLYYTSARSWDSQKTTLSQQGFVDNDCSLEFTQLAKTTRKSSVEECIFDYSSVSNNPIINVWNIVLYFLDRHSFDITSLVSSLFTHLLFTVCCGAIYRYTVVGVCSQILM